MKPCSACRFFQLIQFLLPVASAVATSVSDGLLLYLPLSQDFADHSANHLAVVNSNAVRIVDGAAYFDGRTNWLELPCVPLARRSFAISMWVKVTGTHPMYGLLEQKEADRPNQWLHVMLRGGRQPYLGFYVNDTISPRDVLLNAWTHLVFQYNGTHQEIWVNGEFMCQRKARTYGGAGGVTRIGYTPR